MKSGESEWLVSLAKTHLSSEVERTCPMTVQVHLAMLTCKTIIVSSLTRYVEVYYLNYIAVIMSCWRSDVSLFATEVTVSLLQTEKCYSSNNNHNKYIPLSQNTAGNTTKLSRIVSLCISVHVA